MKELRTNRNVVCIDLKSFYASVECAMRGLDPFKTPLVVADPTRGGGSIVLAVSPFLRKQGVPSRLRVYELPKNKKIIMAKPRMDTYLRYSTEIINIFLDFVSDEDLYVYSIDEAFLDLTTYRNYYRMEVIDIVQVILRRIEDELKIPAACGIGQNMVMAKLALDIDAKHSPNFIAEWTYDNLEERLWPVKPLSEMWGIGSRLEKSLNELGMFKIGDVANADINLLKKHFGVIGEELYYHTNGIDLSDITDRRPMTKAKSYGLGQTLYQDYFKEGIEVVIREMVDDVTMRMRLSEKTGKTVHLSIGYSKSSGGGFGRQMKLDFPTNDPDVVYQTCMTIFNTFYDSSPIRRVSISVSNLELDDHATQLSLFDNPIDNEKKRALLQAIDGIKQQYGKNSILRANSKTKESTVIKRNELIGGHNAY